MDFQKTWFIGVDTHKQEHTAVAIDAFHQVKINVTFPNNPKYFARFIQKLDKECPPDHNLVFGLEDTQGLGRSLAQWLVHQGFVVKEVNPVHTDRQRAQSPDPDKSDPKDAQAVAEVLYKRWDDLPQVRSDGRSKALKEALRVREQMVKRKTSVKNQLHACLHEQYPEYKKFFSDIFGKTALAFFERFPSPAHLKHYGVKRLGSFFKEQARNMGQPQAKAILELVDKSQPRDKATDTRDELIPALIQQLRLLEEHIEEIDQRISELVEESEYQLTTMPGIGDYLAAVFESEIRRIERFDSADKLARYAGVAPVEHSSGSRKRTTHRPYGRRRLNKAFYLVALNQIKMRRGRPTNPEARRYFEKKLKEGKSKPAAIRCLMRRLVDIVYAMMRDRSAYRLPKQKLPSRQVI